MMYIHPLVQVAALLPALYALWLGWLRFRSRHLGGEAPFMRQRHILLGRIALSLWLGGTILGLVMARWAWRSWLITGLHGKLGLVALCLIIWGVASGNWLARFPTKRVLLPLLHGLGNLVLLSLALIQFFIGAEVTATFLDGT